MKSFVTVLITIAVTAVLITGSMRFMQISFADPNADLLTTAENMVRKNWISRCHRISRQLSEFGATIASNNDFSLKVLVENDRSSRIVTTMASQFMKPMYFTVLEILDSSATILSSGHFPANAGNKSRKMKTLPDDPIICTENILGKNTLTLQTAKKFTIADIPFIVAGGTIIDSAFLAELCPSDNIRLALKNGETLLSNGDAIHSVSPLENSEIIINDIKYPATSLMLPSITTGDSLTLYIYIASI